MLASEFWALKTTTLPCKGEDRCHWCGAPCNRQWEHDEPKPMPFVKTPPSTAKCPSNPYICRGCWSFRRKSVSVEWLSTHTLKDRQQAQDHSWWVDSDGVFALRAQDADTLYDLLLRPPLKFILAVRHRLGEPNLLHRWLLNDHQEIRGVTPLTFTVDNEPHCYTTHELEHCLRQGPQGRLPSVQLLVAIFGPHALPPIKEQVGAGRPESLDKGNPGKQTIRKMQQRR